MRDRVKQAAGPGEALAGSRPQANRPQSGAESPEDTLGGSPAEEPLPWEQVWEQ